MAITNNGTVNDLPDAQLPSGYTRPTVTTFTDHEYVNDLSLTVLKATVEDSTASTTMDNIFDNGTIGLDKQIIDIVAADFLASATVTTYAELTALSNNLAPTGLGTDVFLTDTSASYTCTVKLFVKTS